MICGVSIRGSYHESNQDSFKYGRLSHGFVLVLSDGLGSLQLSKLGSAAICRVVVELANELKDELYEIDPKDFARRAHERWIRELSPYEIQQCYATVLTFVSYKDRSFALRLGDGFIGACLGESLHSLFDSKDNCFANQTDCLSEFFMPERLDCIDIRNKTVHGVVLCSDGITLSNMSSDVIECFTKECIQGYSTMSKRRVKDHIKSWVETWPSNDDKTIVCFVA